MTESKALYASQRVVIRTSRLCEDGGRAVQVDGVFQHMAFDDLLQALLRDGWKVIELEEPRSLIARGKGRPILIVAADLSFTLSRLETEGEGISLLAMVGR